jgi:hypothetical protein
MSLQRKLTRGACGVECAGGLVAAAVLAAPSGASATAGQPLVLGTGNVTAAGTSYSYTGLVADPRYGTWNWTERDYDDNGPGFRVAGAIRSDAVWIYGGLWTAHTTTQHLFAGSEDADDVAHLESFGTGRALVAKASSNAGAAAISNGAAGPGLVASSTSGAQLRLQASAASNHPRSGVLGDLFLDRTARLWFCKGGTSWKQIA